MKNLYKFHMHTHSSHESASSMRGIADKCKELKLDGSFITDHDNRISVNKNAVFRYDVAEIGSLNTQTDTSTSKHWSGWVHERNSDVSVGIANGKKCMRLRANPGSACTAEFSSHGKRHQVSLLAQLTMLLDFCPIGFDPSVHGIMVDITLSQRPPEFFMGHLCYLAGQCPPMPDTYWIRPLELKEGWQNLIFHITKDALEFDEFGEDNCFASLKLKLFCQEGAKGFSLAHNRYELSRELWAQPLFEKQKELAERISHANGVTLYVATEISGLGQHKISFSESVPIIDYQKENYPSGAEFAIEHLKRYGGVYSYNHMFDAFKRMTLDDSQRLEIIQKRLNEMTESRCDGADLIEVGYPDTRAGFTIHEHMYIWDQLTLRGIFLTGYGNNDSHSCGHSWDSGNNFCAHIYAESKDRETLIQALKQGNCYSADPVIWKDGTFTMDCNGKPMGSAIRTEYGGNYRIEFKLTPPVSGRFKLVISSHDRIIDEHLINKDGVFTFYADIETQQSVEAVRAMLYDLSGRCALFSNPIYFVSDPETMIHVGRLGSS